jgi:hypothetical protein
MLTIGLVCLALAGARLRLAETRARRRHGQTAAAGETDGVSR